MPRVGTSQILIVLVCDALETVGQLSIASAIPSLSVSAPMMTNAVAPAANAV
jgi:hypothetical protein